ASFESVDVAFFAAGEQITAEWAGRATAAGATVIDLSQLYAAEPDVPLVIPEINAEAVGEHAVRGIIASPDPAALQLAVVLRPLQVEAGLKRVVVASYQPVSELGRAGIEELSQQTVALLSGRDVEVRTFPQRVAFNILPQAGQFLAAGYTRGEQLLIEQTRRLLGNPALAITATSVRVPVFYGLSQSVNVETEQPLAAADARALLGRAAGVLVEDDPSNGTYPSPMTAVGTDAICVGRIRDDDSTAAAINLWICGDNLRRGAAVNAVAIAEILVREYL
ncbi:MAG TPA: aspartate-semialdehyde dehydrogenase, partial [Candidatus Kryptonia bacterium]|nr:aspartate-semialdehyde dehydrogenase [Candidatus Kryptonia bacterium]